MAEPRGRVRVHLHDLLAGLDGVELTGDPNVEVTAITHDSRLVEPGACFACIPGALADGHAYAAAAVAAGAVALLAERPLALEVSQARVPSVRRALGPVSASFFGHPSRALRCLGVTGTNGKTTTTYLLEAIARGAAERVGVIGTVGVRIAGEPIESQHTTPEATELQQILARMRDSGVTTVAMEVSSHALDQHRVDGTWFEAACFTNLSHEHLDHHGTIEAYFEAKAALFDPGRVGAGAVNADDPYGLALVQRARARGLAVSTFGIDSKTADLTAVELVPDPKGTRFTLVDRGAGVRIDVELPLIGAFNVANALAAATTARVAGFDLDAIGAGLRAPIVIPGRFERVETGQPFSVFVDYAHTPDALSRVLQAARTLTSGAGSTGRVIVVFGCGGDRDHAKRPLMGEAVARGADLAVLTSDNPRSEDPQAIVDAVLPGFGRRSAPVAVQLDRRAAIAQAFAEATAGDVVVIAGKGHETGQTSGTITVPFDDRVVAREELRALGWS
ncbi:MAG: UDP-N-acetylmuramoyl-L-alanyl-D-glutamate--2,6-diaminopimelate ligase [Acidimicrobiia bacterium]